MLKLYGGARSRASIVQWYLEELSVPYEFVLLDMQAGEHQKPEYLAINPTGKVPAIVDGDFKLWESGAILLYIAQKYGNISPSLEQQAELIQWVLFANATLGPGIFVEATREKETPKLLTPLNQIFEKQPFVLGQDFRGVDGTCAHHFHQHRHVFAVIAVAHRQREIFVHRFANWKGVRLRRINPDDGHSPRFFDALHAPHQGL